MLTLSEREALVLAVILDNVAGSPRPGLSPRSEADAMRRKVYTLLGMDSLWLSMVTSYPDALQEIQDLMKGHIEFADWQTDWVERAAAEKDKLDFIP